MSLYGRWSMWAPALALGLAGLIAVGAATGLAAPAVTGARFEVALEGKIKRASDGELTSQGTFKSQAPFCATGTFVDEGPIRYGGAKRRFTCDDDTGSLTVSIALREYYASGTMNTKWQILHGSNGYARIRGGGELRGELLS